MAILTVMFLLLSLRLMIRLKFYRRRGRPTTRLKAAINRSPHTAECNARAGPLWAGGFTYAHRDQVWSRLRANLHQLRLRRQLIAAGVDPPAGVKMLAVGAVVVEEE